MNTSNIFRDGQLSTFTSNDGQIPHLMIILNELREANAAADDKTCAIKDKLLSMLNWSEETLPLQEKPIRENQGAAIDNFYMQIDSFKILNEKLRNILLHLSQIA